MSVSVTFLSQMNFSELFKNFVINHNSLKIKLGKIIKSFFLKL